MRRKTFIEFMDSKKRETIKQLKIVKDILEHNGFKVESFLHSDEGRDPYIFCYNPEGNTSFDGIRIYKIGNTIAFRVQNESTTHPYGDSYPLPIEEMFHDFLTDSNNQEKAAKKVIKAVGKEIKRFFEKSANVEKEEIGSYVAHQNVDDPVIMRTTGTDYSALIYNVR